MAFELPDFNGRLGELLPLVILASQSPARRRLLEERGCQVIVSPTHCDEDHEGMQIIQVVESLSLRKLQAYRDSQPQQSFPILAADTLILQRDTVMGKARTREAAFSQLRAFSGDSHEVFSGFALCFAENGMLAPTIIHGSDRALVEFDKLSDSDIDTYLDTGEWIGAAGSYRVQGLGRHLISRIDGDYSTVVGLPINRISAILEKLVKDI